MLLISVFDIFLQYFFKIGIDIYIEILYNIQNQEKGDEKNEKKEFILIFNM